MTSTDYFHLKLKDLRAYTHIHHIYNTYNRILKSLQSKLKPMTWGNTFNILSRQITL